MLNTLSYCVHFPLLRLHILHHLLYPLFFFSLLLKAIRAESHASSIWVVDTYAGHFHFVFVLWLLVAVIVLLAISKYGVEVMWLEKLHSIGVRQRWRIVLALRRVHGMRAACPMRLRRWRVNKHVNGVIRVHDQSKRRKYENNFRKF